jgi:hypothetical protein
MRRFLFYVILFVSLSIFLMSGNAYCAPKVKVDEPVFDAGEIPQGKQISHEFTIENVGDETLTIMVKPC